MLCYTQDSKTCKVGTMKVIRKANFTTVQNSLLRNKNISLKAKGLFAYMASFNKNWNFTIRSMTLQLKDGRDSINSGLKELINNGFITYKKNFDGTGVYTLHDEPQVENPHQENPDKVEPNPENPHPENPTYGKSGRIKNNNPIRKTIHKKVDEELLISWNEFAQENGLASVIKITKSRKEKIDTRKKEVQDLLGVFKVALQTATKSSFLMGTNKRGWKMNFDWIIENDKNIIKVIEGAYND